VFRKGNRQFNIPSQQYRNWHLSASQQLIGGKKIVGACEVQITFQMPDNRKADLTNKAESIMDLLVDLKIIEDDSWKHIPRLILICDGVNKENPGADIWLRQIH
jgi:Holliday junction resolvase RusA-like endonuclease